MASMGYMEASERVSESVGKTRKNGGRLKIGRGGGTNIWRDGARIHRSKILYTEVIPEAVIMAQMQ